MHGLHFVGFRDFHFAESLDLGVLGHHFRQEQVEMRAVRFDWVLHHVDVYEVWELEESERDSEVWKLVPMQVDFLQGWQLWKTFLFDLLYLVLLEVELPQFGQGFPTLQSGDHVDRQVEDFKIGHVFEGCQVFELVVN